jgi:hypothetical protein
VRKVFSQATLVPPINLFLGERWRLLRQKVRTFISGRRNLVHILSSPVLFPATGFSAAFPGITPHLLTLNSNFQMPFYRDIILALGVCSVSKQSCSNILKSGPGSAITIVVGGAAESLSARPGTADLTLRKRCVFFLPWSWVPFYDALY